MTTLTAKHNVLLALLAISSVGYSQAFARFEEAKRMGMAFVQSEQFDKAAGRLEEVWEQDHSDPVVGEFLAVAYLNTEDRHVLPSLEKQAFAIIGQLLATRARVTFMVHHSHEKMTWLQGRELNQYCSGRLSIKGDQLSFIASKGERTTDHSFEANLPSLKKVELAGSDTRGIFEVKTHSRNYVLATRNRNRNEARFIVSLLTGTLNRQNQ